MTTEEIYRICEKYKIKNYTINDDLSIDVDGNVDLYAKELKELPLKFRNVNGNFECSWNNLTSLKGAPSSVGRNFECYKNILTSLEGAPIEVGERFDCSHNNLKSLYGAPSYIGSEFVCYSNPLESLKGIPSNIKENNLIPPLRFNYSDYLAHFRDLKFKMTTQEIHEICYKYNIKNYTINEDLSIDVYENVNLYGRDLFELPLRFRNVTGWFDCSWNNLTTLEGAPSYVGGKFYCYYNNLTSLEGIPNNIKEHHIILPDNFTYSDYLTYCKVVERYSKFKKILKCQ